MMKIKSIKNIAKPLLRGHL